MTEPEAPRPLDDLEARLKAARERQNGGKRGGAGAKEAPLAGLGFAVRIGVEMVAALAVGAGIGWLLDQWLGTGPWLMVVFLILGMGAAVMSVYRVMMGLGSAVGYGAAKDDENGPDTGHGG
jgi:ATP synthase protein I